MDALVRLVGAALSWLHGTVGPDVCPGGWAWATTVFGVLVGLLPTAGALLVAALRRRRGPERPLGRFAVAAIALTSCGVLPWLAFRATGAVYRGIGREGQGLSAVGLAAADRASLLAPTCLDIQQRGYLGTVPVSAALGQTDVLGALLVLPLVVFPILVALLVWVQGRTALRRASARPARYFWLPVVLLALFSGSLPAGATAQLWTGLLLAATAGAFLVPRVPAPTRAARPETSSPSRPETSPPARPADSPRDGVDRSRPRPLRQVLPGFSVPDRRVTPSAPAREPAASDTPAASSSPATSGPARAVRLGVPAWEVARGQALTGLRRAREAWAAGARRPQPAPAAAGPGAPAPVSTPPPGAASAPLAATPGQPVPTPPAAESVQQRAGDAEVPPPRLPPTLVGAPSGVDQRFELIRPLGAGGFGGVWLAMDHHLGEQVAIKSALAPDHDTELRIRREARALSAVEHPHCVRILDLVATHTDPGLGQLRGLAIVMEYVDGCSLGDQVVEHGTVDDVTAARVWLHTAGALHAAHRRGVLHRDVKPTNVVLDAAGQPHLIDFGIARAPGDATLTTQGVVIGTPDFLAPETARGEPASPAADGWGLAATVSWALTGQPPRGDHQDAVAGLRAAAASIGPIHVPEHSAHRNLVAASLDADPAARPGLPEVRDVLERWLAHGAPSDGPVPAARGRHPR